MIYDVAIIGAGLAGLCAAIDLQKRGFSVLLMEKNTFPRHKVCGEYVSNEVKPYLKALGIDVDQFAISIKRFAFSTSQGHMIERPLDMGGFGWSRYAMDDYLWRHAQAMGVHCLTDELLDRKYDGQLHQLVSKGGKQMLAREMVAAYGKRNKLDRQWGRDFARERSPWMGVKAHYQGELPKDKVTLHHFRGGYCGVSQVENERVNVCYLIHQSVFSEYGNLEGVEKELLSSNPYLAQFLADSTMLFPQSLRISQIYFGNRNSAEDQVFYIGDAAGMIHPLAGNGMAMAIGSAQMLSVILAQGGANKAERYRKAWDQRYRSRILLGRRIQRLLEKPGLTEWGMRVLPYVPRVLDEIIKRTHGKYLTWEK